MSAGRIQSPASNTGSVDKDDGTLDESGTIDGSGTLGHSWFFGSGASGLTFTFPSPVTAAAGVWTDGSGTITFEAFGPGMVSLGTVTGTHAGTGSTSTAEDRFYGVLDTAGIIAIKLSNSGFQSGIEVDHIQYGTAVPEPAGMALLGVGSLLLMRRRRK